MITEKELAAYLPYKLQLLETHSSKIGTLSNIYTLGKGYSTDDIKISIDYCEAEHLWMFKPILHPLSSLTKEITINGETFVPIERLFEMKYPDHSAKGRDYYIESVPNWVLCSGNWTAVSFKFSLNMVDNNHHWAVQKLAEWRIDFTNMIERVAAIAVSENFNPYK